MGIDTSAVLMVGLSSEELAGGCDYYYEVLEEKGLSNISPYYDADYDSCNIGIVIESSPDYQSSEVDEETLLSRINEAKEKFFTVTGKSGKLFISPCIS